jgi:paraquat-inducible protein B
MPATRSALVGGFLLGGLALAVGAILLVGGTHLFAPVTRAVTFFSGPVAGLSVGAPVTFRGVRVGSVESIALEIAPRTLDARIPVVLQIEPGKIIWEEEPGVTGPALLKRAIDAGLRAQLSLQSVVTGQLQVDLDFLPGTKPVTSGTQRSAELSQVLASIDRTSKVAERLLVSVNSMTDARSPMRANLDATLRDLAASAASLRGFASDVERNPNLILTGRSRR